MGLTNFNSVVISNDGSNIMCCGPIKWDEGDASANEVRILEITLLYNGEVIARSEGQSGLYKKNLPNKIWSLEAFPLSGSKVESAVGQTITARGQFWQDGSPPVVEWSDDVNLDGCPSTPAAAS